MRHLAVLSLLALSASGCVGQLRLAVSEHSHLAKRYAEKPIHATLDQWWELLDTLQPAGQCLSLNPCLKERQRVSPQQIHFCTQWGVDDCYMVTATEGGTVVQEFEVPTRSTLSSALEWFVSRLDPPEHTAATEDASAQALQELNRDEEHALEANSFWVQAHVTARFQENALGLHARGGWRRWLTSNLALAIGPGYERTFNKPLLRDALSLTARFEVAPFDTSRSRFAGLPMISGYAGVTGMASITPQPGTTIRAFVGLSTLALISAEAGVSMFQTEGHSPAPSFYFGLGLGL